MLKKIKNKKFAIAAFMLVVFVLLFIFLPASPAFAAPTKLFTKAKDAGISILFFIIESAISLVGSLLILLMKLLIMLSLYNDFINNPYVQKGWVMLRDLVNMFFILGLLLIAFGTVLKIEKYSYNKLLGRLLIMAILVNFSRTICGIIIDFFQVIMITFVKDFKDITEGNIMEWFGAKELWKRKSHSQPEANQAAEAVVNALFGLVFITIGTIVVAIFCVILAFRIVALWILIVVSPLAFFAWTFEPAGGGIASLAQQWQQHLWKYCIVGPVLAFFLWLSLISMSTVAVKIEDNAAAGGFAREKMQDQVFDSAAGNASKSVGFLMGVLMLIGGLFFAGQMGVVGSS